MNGEVVPIRIIGHDSSHRDSSYRILLESLNSKSFQGICYGDASQVKFFRISTRVKAQKMRLESTRVRVTDLTKLGVSAHNYIRQSNERGKGSQNVSSCVTVDCDID